MELKELNESKVCEILKIDPEDSIAFKPTKKNSVIIKDTFTM